MYLKSMMLPLAWLALSAQSPVAAYAEGQVWEYERAAADSQSLVKIQLIEELPGDTLIYHVSLSGITIAHGEPPAVAHHIPVSQETLDRSVTRLSDSDFEAEHFEEGYAEWKSAEGGVFTITLAEIAEILRDVLR